MGSRDDDEVLEDSALPDGVHAVEAARHRVRDAVHRIAPTLVDDCCLVTSELVTNGVIHAAPPMRIRIRRRGVGIRVEVVDSLPDRIPVPAGTGLADVLALDVSDPTADDLLDVETMTGRGLIVVAAITDDWGVDVEERTKTVWADVGTEPPEQHPSEQPPEAEVATTAGNVRLRAVPARLVLASAANLDDLVRELQVLGAREADLGTLAGSLRSLSAHVREPLRMAARDAIAHGHRLVDVAIPGDDRAVTVLRDFLAVLDDIGEHCRHGDLLTLEPDPEVSAFRTWYVEEIDRQVGGAAPQACPFPAVALDDPKVVAAAARARRQVASDDGLPADVAGREFVVDQEPDRALGAQLAAFLRDTVGASSTSLCTADLDTGTVRIGWADHYPDDVLAGWDSFSLFDDLPASETIRTGRPSFFRTVEERDARFPIFTRTPVIGDEALAVLPVTPEAALVVGFAQRRSFGDAERAFLVRVAEEAGRALRRGVPPA